MLYELRRFHKLRLSTENNVGTKHTMASLFTVLFPAMEVKPNFKNSSKYLRFLFMVKIEIKVS